MLKWIVIFIVVIVLLILFIILSIAVDYISNCIGWEVWPKIIRSRRAIRKLVAVYCPCARVSSFGATHISPQHLCICINTSTDFERDQLLEDAKLMQGFREALFTAGYPADAVPFVGFSIESQETVDRNFAGNWYYARK